MSLFMSTSAPTWSHDTDGFLCACLVRMGPTVHSLVKHVKMEHFDFKAGVYKMSAIAC